MKPAFAGCVETVGIPIMVLTEDDLFGKDALSAKRAAGWKALCSWMTNRFSRQRGINLPNIFHIGWQVVGADAGSRIRRPVFILSERFMENHGVHPVYPPLPHAPEPAPGDELNFYQLAISHSESLSKDDCFVAVRDVLAQIGEAAATGRELHVDFGIGTLVCKDREVDFEFSGAYAGGTHRERGEASECCDPMLGARMSAEQAAGLTLAGIGGGSVLGGSVLGNNKSISAEEESQLFRDIDALDPETRGDVDDMLFKLRELGLEQPTKAQLMSALHVDQEALGERTATEVSAALGKRAAELERRLRESQNETRELEARLQRKKVEADSRLQRKPAVPAKHAAANPMHSPNSSALHVGGSSQRRLNTASSVPRTAPTVPKAAQLRAVSGGFGAGGAPMLSVGFNAEGPATKVAPPKRPSPQMASKQQTLLPRVRVPVKPDSHDCSSDDAHLQKQVPTAPPLPPFRPPMPTSHDAATTAWRMHAAPGAPVAPLGHKATAGRAVGKLAPGTAVMAQCRAQR